MKNFLLTHELYRPGTPLTSVDLPAGLPDELANALMEVGSGALYAKGFFRFVIPPAFGEYLELWRQNPSECHAFLKCAFGHIVFYQNGQYKVLNPVFNDIDDLGDLPSLNFAINIALCDRPALESSFLLDVYEEAFPRLGIPELDEIYAFVPALGLGGSRDAANVRKVKMAAEMQILSQL